LRKFRCCERRVVLEEVVPVGFGQFLAHDRRRQPGGVSAGHQPAHAGAGDAVHRHAQFFEHFENADMRRAARATAAENQADAWPAAGAASAGCTALTGWREADAGAAAFAGIPATIAASSMPPEEEVHDCSVRMEVLVTSDSLPSRRRPG
jgi:hypothetical protein